MGSKDSVLHAQLEVQGCTAELYLNDIPLMRLDAKKNVFETRAVEEYLVPGVNWLEVLVMPGRTPSVARSERRSLTVSGAKAKARLVRFEEGEWTNNPGKELGAVSYDSDATPLPGAPPEVDKDWPRSRAVQIEMGSGNGRWGWQDAPELSMTPELVAEAKAVVDDVAAAMRTGNGDWLWQLQELQVKDALGAYPAWSEASMKSNMLDGVKDYSALPDCVLATDPEELDFRLVGGGRLIECVNKDWLPTLRLRGPKTGMPVPFEMMLARIDGKLRVVR